MEISKLEQLAKLQQQRQSRQSFQKVVVYLGAEAREHFAKKRDSQGQVLKDDSGNDLREDTPDGVTLSFSEVGTSSLVKVVYPSNQAPDLKMMGAYVVSGMGFNINSANMLFLDQKVKISEYK